MVDVGAKAITPRTAVAQGRINMLPTTLASIKSSGNRKGEVLVVAKTAGIMAAKKTSELIPLCHPLMLTMIDIKLCYDDEGSGVLCQATTQTLEKTGVEIEALTAVQVTLLTIYDMCKAVDRGMEMTDIRLVHKSGGKSGEWNRDNIKIMR